MKTRDLYPIEDARFLLGGISRNTIYGLIRAGDLTTVTIGRRRFVAASAIDRFIERVSQPVVLQAVSRASRIAARQLPLALAARFVTSPRVAVNGDVPLASAESPSRPKA
jgi:hypothetical protein